MVAGSAVRAFAVPSGSLGVVAELGLGGLGAGTGDSVGPALSVEVEPPMVVPAVAEFDANGPEEALLDSDPVCGAAGEFSSGS